MVLTEIPELSSFDNQGPGWLRVTSHGDGKVLKPLIKCKCGHVTGIGLHHVHADGRVTASFWHNAEPVTQGNRTFPGGGCGWHVHLKLLGYDLGDFPPTGK